MKRLHCAKVVDYILTAETICGRLLHELIGISFINTRTLPPQQHKEFLVKIKSTLSKNQQLPSVPS